MPGHEVINYAKLTGTDGVCDSNELIDDADEEGHDYLVLKLKELKASLCTKPL
jgi:hypothetical protein